MKSRIFLMAAVLVGGFVLITSLAKWNPRRLLEPVREASRVWTEPDRAHGAGLNADELNNVDIYKTANRATVNITTVVYQENWFFQLVPVQGAGSGFLIDADGLILSNFHVAGGRPERISVTLADRSTYDAQVLYTDQGNDLALMRVNPKKKLPFLRLGDSDNLQVGQKVLAIGNPFGLSGTLTTGIISSLNRSLQTGDGALEDMIQTDAAINRGNSGGPLLDSQGSVIGVNTAIVGEANIGIGFAMPVSRAKAMLEDYQSQRTHGRAVLGVDAMYVSGELAEALDLPAEGGLLVSRVERGSPAAEAGIRGATRSVIVGGYRIGVGGDLIMGVDGRTVNGNDFLKQVLRRKRPGDTLELTIYREGRTIKVRSKLGEAGGTRL
jgi:S1-C subfamily serine protease